VCVDLCAGQLGFNRRRGAVVGKAPVARVRLAPARATNQLVPNLGSALKEKRGGAPTTAETPPGFFRISFRNSPHTLDSRSVCSIPISLNGTSQSCQERVTAGPLIWLDNAATTQKPNAVIDRLTSFYSTRKLQHSPCGARPRRSRTDAYEGAREKVRRFLNASSTREIIFVARRHRRHKSRRQKLGHRNIQKDDENRHSPGWSTMPTLVPWQQLAAEKGARLRVAPVDDTGQIILEEYENAAGPRTRIVAFSQVSNALAR